MEILFAGGMIIIMAIFHSKINPININVCGCTDSTAFNYNPNANMDDGSCCYDCATIEGYVYKDLDTNGVFDNNIEIAFPTQIIQLEKMNGDLSYLTTGANGYYSFTVGTGQKEIKHQPPSFWVSSNNTSQYNINIQSEAFILE